MSWGAAAGVAAFLLVFTLPLLFAMMSRHRGVRRGEPPRHPFPLPPRGIEYGDPGHHDSVGLPSAGWADDDDAGE